MTTHGLMDAMHAALIEIFDGMEFKNQDGVLRPVTIYRQRWPEIAYFSEAAADARIALPSCCIFLPGFKTKMKMNKDEPPIWEQRPVFLIFNVYEEMDDGRATLDLITMAEAVKRRFLLDPVLQPGFIVDQDIEFDVENINETPVHASPLTMTAWSKMHEAQLETVPPKRKPGPPWPVDTPGPWPFAGHYGAGAVEL